MSIRKVLLDRQSNSKAGSNRVGRPLSGFRVRLQGIKKKKTQEDLLMAARTGERAGLLATERDAERFGRFDQLSVGRNKFQSLRRFG